MLFREIPPMPDEVQTRLWARVDQRGEGECCGRQYTADEPHYYDEQNYTEETCDDCGQTFDVEVCTSTTWSCDGRAHTPADPLKDIRNTDR